MVNGYLLSLAALFALGGRLSDIFGHRRMCVLGVIILTAASGLCGLTPKGPRPKRGSWPSASCRARAER